MKVIIVLLLISKDWTLALDLDPALHHALDLAPAKGQLIL